MKQKTKETDVNVTDFINSFVDNELKRIDSFQLIQLMQQWSGYEPKIWGTSIIGFGSYHYKYKTGHEGDSILIGFSPRKAEFSLYVYSPCLENKKHLKNLGKYKMGKACIYFKKLSDLNLETLEKISLATIEFLNNHNTL